MANTFYTFASAASTRMPIESGLDIIISHFEPYFPRRISTHTTRGEQILVYSREETLARFRQSNLIDCRISTYPYPVPVSYEGVNMQPPNFFLSDIDRKDFKTNKSFNDAMQQTLQNFRDKLRGGSPSVLWSGGGCGHSFRNGGYLCEVQRTFKEVDAVCRDVGNRYDRI